MYMVYGIWLVYGTIGVRYMTLCVFIWVHIKLIKWDSIEDTHASLENLIFKGARTG